jgi:hypothetical protein
MVNGGDAPHYAIVFPMKGGADMAPLEPSFEQMLEKAFGKFEAREILEGFGKTIARNWSEVLVYRPELSYRPSGK